MNEIKHKKYKSFAGPVVHGAYCMIPPNDDDTFLEKLVYLTAMVESGGYYGSVYMADGTGITAGLCQHVSVLPKTMQWGDLWKLIAFVDSFFSVGLYDLGQLLEDVRWSFQPDGVLRWYGRNTAVSAGSFRDTVTPVGGVVPEPVEGQSPADRNRWLTSKRWCLAVRQILVQPRTHRAQLIYECRHFQKMIERTRFRGVLGGKAVSTVAFTGGVAHDKPFEDPHVELAMLVMLSFAVNAPKWAYAALDKTVGSHGVEGFVPSIKRVSAPSKLFACELVKNLEHIGGTKWDDDKKYGRYQRTRGVLKGMFDDDVLAVVMPLDLPE